MNTQEFCLRVSSESDFPDWAKILVEEEFRKSVYKFMLLRKDYTEYYDVSKVDTELLQKIRDDLEKCGWTTALSYGDTGLFIYKGEKPKNCW